MEEHRDQDERGRPHLGADGSGSVFEEDAAGWRGRTLNRRGGMIGDLCVNDSQSAAIIRITPPIVRSDIVAGEFPRVQL